MEKLKALLRKECAHIPSDELLDRFLSLGVSRCYDSGSVLTETGVTDTNVYVVKRGIVRFSDFDGDRERTFAFALPGTVFYNKYSFVKNLNSYYQVDIWGKGELIVISRADWQRLVSECHEAALWMLSYVQEELFFRNTKTPASTTAVQLSVSSRFYVSDRNYFVMCRKEYLPRISG